MSGKAAPSKKPFRVWIELDNPKGCRESYLLTEVALANTMLFKIGVGARFEVQEGKYILVHHDSGLYTELPENGHWFDLTFVGSE